MPTHLRFALLTPSAKTRLFQRNHRITPSSRRTARATVGGGLPIRTLSVVRRVHSSPWLPFPSSPLLIPDGRISRVRLAAAACFTEPLSCGALAQVLAHVHPRIPRLWIPLRCSLAFCRSAPAQCPAAGPRHNHCQPRAPLRVERCYRSRPALRRRSAGVTPPSSLLQAHASDRPAPFGFGVVPNPSGLCRLCRVPAASRPFPTLSLRSLYRRLGPYPATLGRCIYPFLPARPRPLHRVNCIGSWKDPATQLCAGAEFRGCNHSLMFRLRYSLGPQSAPTFKALCPRRRWAVYTALNPRRRRPRAAASLRV